MKKNAASLTAAMVLVVASGLAHASEDAGLYFAVQGGALAYASGDLDKNYGTAPTSDNTVWGGDVGKPIGGIVGLQFGPSFAVEGAATYLGRTYYAGRSALGTVTAESRAFTSRVSLVFIASGGRPGDYVSLLVKAGIGMLRSKSSVTTTIPVTAQMTPFGDGTSIRPTFGFAINSDINSYFSLRFDWDSWGTGGSTTNSTGRFQTYMFGIGLKF